MTFCFILHIIIGKMERWISIKLSMHSIVINPYLVEKNAFSVNSKKALLVWQSQKQMPNRQCLGLVAPDFNFHYFLPVRFSWLTLSTWLVKCNILKWLHVCTWWYVYDPDDWAIPFFFLLTDYESHVHVTYFYFVMMTFPVWMTSVSLNLTLTYCNNT